MNIDVTAQAGYDIVTALRGPDSTSDLSFTLKVLFTARLRHFVGVKQATDFVVCRTDADRVPTYADLDLEAWDGQPDYWLGGTTHFLCHVARAFNGIAEGDLAESVIAEASWLADIAESLLEVALDARHGSNNPNDPGKTLRDAETQYQEYLRHPGDREVE